MQYCFSFPVYSFCLCVIIFHSNTFCIIGVDQYAELMSEAENRLQFLLFVMVSFKKGKYWLSSINNLFNFWKSLHSLFFSFPFLFPSHVFLYINVTDAAPKVCKISLFGHDVFISSLQRSICKFLRDVFIFH